jgi:hypothetical protein
VGAAGASTAACVRATGGGWRGGVFVSADQRRELTKPKLSLLRLCDGSELRIARLVAVGEGCRGGVLWR